MKLTGILLTLALLTLCPVVASAQSARQLTPVYVDPYGGYLYFIVDNRWSKPIHNLFGWVYGYGSTEVPGTYLVNNPNSRGMKVSIGAHAPGTAAMYRFKIPVGWLYFPEYTLQVSDDSLFGPDRPDGVYR